MAQNYVKSGRTLTLAAPYIVAAGAGALIGNIFGVSLEALAASASGEFTTEGVWSLAKVSTEVWVVGEKIYWDNTNKRCSNVPTAGFNLIGVCTEAAANPSTTGKVKLLG